MTTPKTTGKKTLRAGLVKAGVWPATNADRHLMWLKAHKLAYIRVPKAANSSVRITLARSFGLADADAEPANKDRFWQAVPHHVATSMTLQHFRLHPASKDTWCFTLIRHPASRLYSCWNNKVVENQSVSADMKRMGIEARMDFPSFVDCVASHSDAESDIHVRSLHSIICIDQKLIPDFVGRLEAIGKDWSHIRYEVQMRSGVDLGALMKRNIRINTDVSFFDGLPEKTAHQILIRYADDFQRFYPKFWKRHIDHHHLDDNLDIRSR